MGRHEGGHDTAISPNRVHLQNRILRHSQPIGAAGRFQKIAILQRTYGGGVDGFAANRAKLMCDGADFPIRA